MLPICAYTYTKGSSKKTTKALLQALILLLSLTVESMFTKINSRYWSKYIIPCNTYSVREKKRFIYMSLFSNKDICRELLQKEQSSCR